MEPVDLASLEESSVKGIVLYKSLSFCFSLVVHVPFLNNIFILYQKFKQVSRTIFRNHKILLDLWL